MSVIVLDFLKSIGRQHHASRPAMHIQRDRLRGTNWTMSGQTDLRVLRDERVLAILDADNLDFSLQRHGLQVRYVTLLKRLQSLARAVFPVAVLTTNVADVGRALRLRECGWRALEIPREAVPTSKGLRVAGNADADLAFELGALAAVADCSAVLLGTGDGDLAVSCSRGLRRVCRTRPVAIHTLSVSGSTSARLRQRRDLFSSSILIGMDLLERWFSDSRQNFHNREGASACGGCF